MRRLIASLGAVVIGLAVTQVHAQEPTPSCSAHVDGQWQPLDANSLMTCLASMERAVPVYNAQGFKFGLWGRLLLSGDRYYFYSSRDGGRNWQAVGLKTEVAGVSEAPAQTAAVDTAPQGSPVAADVPASTEPDTPPSASIAVQTPAQTSVDVQTPIGLAARESVAMAAPAAAPAAAAVDRRSCSIHVGSNWERVANLTLEECAAELDKSPNDYDRNGFKYGYWSGIFLAADASEVLKSADSRTWERVLTR